jgi:hypothetical protein
MKFRCWPPVPALSRRSLCIPAVKNSESLSAPRDRCGGGSASTQNFADRFQRSGESKICESWARIPRKNVGAAEVKRQTRLSERHGNHRPVVHPPVAPHIAMMVSAQGATPAMDTGAATIMTSIGRAASSGATDKMIGVQISEAACNCSGGEPAAFEQDRNCKNDRNLTQHAVFLSDAIG